MYQRTLKNTIESYLFDGKIIILLGPRQVGKTTLVDDILVTRSENGVVRWSGDNAFDRDLLSENRLERITPYIGQAEYIFIDEAQKIENI
jgi:predicted AAA+ superfamily ATPase